MGFIDNLKTITPLEFNNTFLNGTSEEIIQQSINNANTTTGGLWFSITIVAVFILIVWLINDKRQGFIYDLPRSTLISSGICLFISIVAAITTISVTIVPIIWFGSILFMSFVGVYMRKEVGK